VGNAHRTNESGSPEGTVQGHFIYVPTAPGAILFKPAHNPITAGEWYKSKRSGVRK
jgi:hypothetical protein